MILRRDMPIQRDDELWFSFSDYAATIANFLLNKNLTPPLTLVVDGEYGSGKSSLMRSIKRIIDSKCHDVYYSKQTSCNFECDQTPKHRLCRTFWFNPWEYQHDDTILNVFFYNLIKQFDLDKKWEFKKNDLKNVFKGLELNLGYVKLNLAGKIASMLPSNVESKYPAADIFLNRADEMLDVLLKCGGDDCLHKSLNSGTALVVFIDDLDRCESKRIQYLMTIIKRLIDSMGERCFFVFGLNLEETKELIKCEKSIGEDVDEYFRKVVQSHFCIPKPSEAEFVNWVFDTFKAVDGEALLIMYPFFQRNPRTAKVMVNNYTILMTVLKYEPIFSGDISQKTAAWISLIENNRGFCFSLTSPINIGVVNGEIVRLGIVGVSFSEDEIKILLRYSGKTI